MGTSTVALAAAALVAVVLALIAWLSVRARNRSEARTREAIWRVSQAMDTFSGQLSGVMDGRRREPATIALPVTLDLDDGLRRVASLAAALPGMTGGAVRVDLDDGRVAVKTVGIPSGATGLEHDFDPPDGAGWRTATISWAHEPLVSSAGRPVQTGVVAQVVDHDGRRIGFVAAYTSAPDAAPDVVDAVAALAASAAPGLSAAREHQALKELVRTDPLTGMLNRRGLEEDLAREVARAARTGTPLSVLMLDLDDFSRLNKRTYQHGDDVLREFARVVREACRESDIPCRRGGEEFTVILPDTTCSAALRVDARIRALVATTSFPHPEDVGERLTYSSGITTLRDGDDAKAIDKRASELVNAVKRAGKDGVQHDCHDVSSPRPHSGDDEDEDA